MIKYIVASNITPGELIFKYNAAGVLIHFECHMDLPDKGFDWLAKNFPFIESEIDKLSGGKLKIAKVADEILFTDFYKAYGYKVGKKDAERAWNKLSDGDKVKAFAYIKVYNSNLTKTPGVARMYPERYLNAARWND